MAAWLIPMCSGVSTPPGWLGEANQPLDLLWSICFWPVAFMLSSFAANYSLRASGSCCVGLAEEADSRFILYGLCGASHVRGSCVCRRKVFDIFFSPEYHFNGLWIIGKRICAWTFPWLPPCEWIPAGQLPRYGSVSHWGSGCVSSLIFQWSK